MFFSILIPVYNAEEYLVECIESVLAQNGEDYEIVLADDGSTDGSTLICNDYAARFPLIVRAVHHENIGALLTRRKLINLAKGKLCLSLDSDDMLLPGALEIIRKIYAKREFDLALFNAYIDTGNGDSNEKKMFPEIDNEIVQMQKHAVQIATVEERLNSLCYKIYHRDLFDIDLDYSAESYIKYGEDLYQSIPLIDKANIIVYINKPLYYHRKNLLGMSRHDLYKRYKGYVKLYERIEEYMVKWALTDGERMLSYEVQIRKLCNIVVSAWEKTRESSDRKILTDLIEQMYSDGYFVDLYKKTRNGVQPRFASVINKYVQHNRTAQLSRSLAVSRYADSLKKRVSIKRVKAFAVRIKRKIIR